MRNRRRKELLGSGAEDDEGAVVVENRGPAASEEGAVQGRMVLIVGRTLVLLACKKQNRAEQKDARKRCLFFRF